MSSEDVIKRFFLIEIHMHTHISNKKLISSDEKKNVCERMKERIGGTGKGWGERSFTLKHLRKNEYKMSSIC